MKNFIDISGHKFNRFTALSFIERKRGHDYWLCRCDCGQSRAVQRRRLTLGHSKSCGCLKNEIIRERSLTHGLRRTVEYRAWSHIKSRCTNPNVWNYHNYGGRGIKVCALWMASFEAFYADLGPRPEGKYSIDRIDNNRGYEPGNCRWATPEMQRANRRDSNRVKDLV